MNSPTPILEPKTLPSNAGRVAKQVIVIRKDLGMGKGKACAQAAHASLGALLTIAHKTHLAVEIMHTEASRAWLDGAFTKITLAVNSESELKAIYAAAADAGLPTALIEDNGLTQFHGIKTPTTVGIGPAWADEIDPITKDLRLY